MYIIHMNMLIADQDRPSH